MMMRSWSLISKIKSLLALYTFYNWQIRDIFSKSWRQKSFSEIWFFLPLWRDSYKVFPFPDARLREQRSEYLEEDFRPGRPSALLQKLSLGGGSGGCGAGSSGGSVCALPRHLRTQAETFLSETLALIRSIWGKVSRAFVLYKFTRISTREKYKSVPTCCLRLFYLSSSFSSSSSSPPSWLKGRNKKGKTSREREVQAPGRNHSIQQSVDQSQFNHPKALEVSSAFLFQRQSSSRWILRGKSVEPGKALSQRILKYWVTSPSPCPACVVTKGRNHKFQRDKSELYCNKSRNSSLWGILMLLSGEALPKTFSFNLLPRISSAPLLCVSCTISFWTPGKVVWFNWNCVLLSLLIPIGPLSGWLSWMFPD